jgi:tRNA(His) 5'-end guanylyltransferase
MVEVTKFLVEETHAIIGYTQSDEITLVLYSDKINSQIYLDRREQKTVSILASLATAKFNGIKSWFLFDYKGYGPAIFDARAFAVPTKTEAANAVLWRVQDARRNAISMAARAHFSHKSLQNLNDQEIREKLLKDADVNFEDYPAFFKSGTFVRRVTRKISPDNSAFNSIPKKYKPNYPVKRSSVEVVNDIPIFTKVLNRTEVIFDQAIPIIKEN